MVEQDKKRQLLLEFPYREIDKLLKQDFVASEFRATQYKAVNSRVPELRESFLKDPPRFRFISEFRSLVYNKEKKIIAEGVWSDSHGKVAMDNDLTVRDAHGVRYPGYFISGDVFILRALPQIKVLIIDTLFGFYAETLRDLQEKGYVVMNPRFQWLVSDPSDKNGYLEIPSPMTRVTI